MLSEKVKRRAKIRRAVMARNPICQYCGMRASSEVDHVIPLAMGGPDTVENAVAACRTCHREKTKQDWLPSKIVSVDGSEVREVIKRKREWRGKGRGRQPMSIK